MSNELYQIGTPIEYTIHDTQVNIGDQDPIYGYTTTAFLQPMAQGPGKVIQPGQAEYILDETTGFTNPNLHRRVDAKILDKDGVELKQIKKLRDAYERAVSNYKHMIGEDDGCCICNCCLLDDAPTSIPEAYAAMEEAREELETYLANTSAYEVVPRDYQFSVLGLNSHRMTIRNNHVDYQDIDSYITKYPEYADIIRQRFKDSEELEIP